MTTLHTRPTPPGWTITDDRAVATARALAMDAVQEAGHGHPGTAMALAPVAHLLWQYHLRHDPVHPQWPGRDRFVLSCGHASILQYTQLYLTGYDLDLPDLQAFRTFGSRTPAHPEVFHTPGIETTTGPLGQGLATAVGMAMAARRERDLLDPSAPVGDSPFDHRVWVLASDGDIQEGVAAEASSLAGHLRLGNLTVLWDDNRIQIDGSTELALTEDTPARYRAYGWHVLEVDKAPDGDVDTAALDTALTEAAQVTDRPTLVVVRTEIAWPAPNARNTSAAHGSALGTAEVAATKLLLGLDPARTFDVPDDVLAATRKVRETGAAARADWTARFEAWRTAEPSRAQLHDRLRSRALPANWAADLPTYPAGSTVATRAASGATLKALAPQLPELWGGSCDLTESNQVAFGEGDFLPGETGRQIHWGVREHAMGAALNGIALHGTTRVLGATFLTFSDYLRPAIRMAALMHLPVTYVFTHDSIALGEDGPTHQPVEHLEALRAIPGLSVVRPADAAETVAAWQVLLERDAGPVALCLARQGLPGWQHRDARTEVAHGGYVLAEATRGGHDVTPAAVLIGTGSEVQIAMAAREHLQAAGTPTRVVSMPCREWFDEQDQDYRSSVLPAGIPRVLVEAGTAGAWWRLLGDRGAAVGLEHFGASGAPDVLYREFGITAEAVVDAATRLIAEGTSRCASAS